MIVQEDTTLGDKFTVLVAGSVIIEQGIRALKTNPAMGRSEAPRHSKFKLAANDDHPHWAHPAFWAPFVVVGEGARRWAKTINQPGTRSRLRSSP